MGYLTDNIRTQIKVSSLSTRHTLEHSRFTRKQWRAWVRLGHTVEGYYDWLAVQVCAEFQEIPNEPT